MLGQQPALTDAFQQGFAACLQLPPITERFEQEMGREMTAAVSAAGVGRPDPDNFSRHYFGNPLHDNQKDVVRALTGTDRLVQVIEPRQAGKTASVAVACAINCEQEGGDWNRAHSEPYRIGIFAPKLGQAQTDIGRIKSWARATGNGRPLIDWEQTTNSKVVWRNGSEIHAVSAAETADNEGGTFNRIIIEEAQKVSDHVVSEVILPMGGATNARIAKVGTVRAIQNHFYRTWHEDQSAIKVWHHWLLCGNYLGQAGYLEYGGRKISRYILDMMPVQLKEHYVRAGVFPSTPDFLYATQNMEYGDFLTQYELRWLEQFGLFLSMDERASLLRGTHGILHHQENLADDLYAGVDFASGSGEDETSVSVWRRVGLVKEKVWGRTWNDIDLPEQKRELINIFGRTGRFPGVKLILGDVGGNGLAVMQDLAAEANMPIHPVNFGANDKQLMHVSMNMKTSMFMDFKRECQSGTLRYGCVDSTWPMEVAMEWRKGARQWQALEQEMLPSGLNRRIQAPDSDHDDVCCADVLGVRAAKLGPQLFGRAQTGRLAVLPHALVRSNIYH